ncbi:uncharacterized mitochondrial protein-like protein [Tanacetum coccineum]
MNTVSTHIHILKLFAGYLHVVGSKRIVVQDAMDEELVALHQTQTWDLVPLPFGKRAINSRGVYEIKTKFHESIERYKALLVAKGYAKSKYTPTDGDTLSDPSLYQFIVGCHFAYAPTTVHWAVVLHILMYLRVNYWVLYISCDSLISWKSKKQDVISKASTEAGYRAMSVTTSEIVWLRWLLVDTGVHINHFTLLHYDNRSAIQIARNSVFHERTKHIEIYFISLVIIFRSGLSLCHLFLLLYILHTYLPSHTHDHIFVL